MWEAACYGNFNLALKSALHIDIIPLMLDTQSFRRTLVSIIWNGEHNLQYSTVHAAKEHPLLTESCVHRPLQNYTVSMLSSLWGQRTR